MCLFYYFYRLCYHHGASVIDDYSQHLCFSVQRNSSHEKSATRLLERESNNSAHSSIQMSYSQIVDGDLSGLEGSISGMSSQLKIARLNAGRGRRSAPHITPEEGCFYLLGQSMACLAKEKILECIESGYVTSYLQISSLSFFY